MATLASFVVPFLVSFVVPFAVFVASFAVPFLAKYFHWFLIPFWVPYLAPILVTFYEFCLYIVIWRLTLLYFSNLWQFGVSNLWWKSRRILIPKRNVVSVLIFEPFIHTKQKKQIHCFLNQKGQNLVIASNSRFREIFDFQTLLYPRTDQTLGESWWCGAREPSRMWGTRGWPSPLAQTGGEWVRPPPE